MKTVKFVSSVCFGILVAGVTFDEGTDDWGMIKEAEAVVGRPLTPGSAAGVARRTSRRVIRRTSTYVAALPPNCQTVVVESTSLHQCGATYYQSSGAQYVVVDVQ